MDNYVALYIIALSVKCLCDVFYIVNYIIVICKQKCTCPFYLKKFRCFILALCIFEFLLQHLRSYQDGPIVVQVTVL